MRISSCLIFLYFRVYPQGKSLDWCMERRYFFLYINSEFRIELGISELRMGWRLVGWSGDFNFMEFICAKWEFDIEKSGYYEKKWEFQRKFYKFIFLGTLYNIHTPLHRELAGEGEDLESVERTLKHQAKIEQESDIKL